MSRRSNLDIILKNMDTEKATKILAKSLYKELMNKGFTNRDIINYSKEMLEHMASEMRSRRCRCLPEEGPSINRLVFPVSLP